MQSRAMETDKEGTSLPWVHAAYYEFKNRLQNFARMINLEPRITQVLLNKHAQEREELVRLIYLPSFTWKKISNSKCQSVFIVACTKMLQHSKILTTWQASFIYAVDVIHITKIT